MPETPKNEKPTLSKRDNLLMALKYLMCTAGAGIIQFVSFTLLNAAAHFFVSASGMGRSLCLNGEKK